MWHSYNVNNNFSRSSQVRLSVTFWLPMYISQEYRRVFKDVTNYKNVSCIVQTFLCHVWDISLRNIGPRGLYTFGVLTALAFNI
jgi:hypothetical protein